MTSAVDRQIVHETAPGPATVVASPTLTGLIDYYWRALLDFQNCLEDVEGADGRLENLKALRWKFLATLQSMEVSLGGTSAAGEAHRAAAVLQHGAPSLGLSAQDLFDRLGLGEREVSAAWLETAMLELGRQIIASLPGQLPAAQGVTGQREIIRAMRLWSRAAEVRGEDLSFLARRLEELG